MNLKPKDEHFKTAFSNLSALNPPKDGEFEKESVKEYT